jgi:CDP-6-deoxy-D-xylo-4-hexulose-3-dehydrase
MNLKKREQNFNLHTKFFKKYEKYFTLPEQLKDSRTGWLAYPLTIKNDAPFTRTKIQIFLEKKNIQTRVVFTGNIMRQPGFKNLKYKKFQKNYLVADNVMKNGFLIACHQGLNNKMINHIHKSIDEFVKINN